MQIFKKFSPDIRIIVLILLIIGIFYSPFIFSGKIPIPGDTVLGMYHPWRDEIWNGLVNGVPFKNYLITDPVRQQFVWRKIGIENIKTGNLPVWNPYSFSGSPLIANFQSAIFYPLNIFFLFMSFTKAWGITVMLQSVMTALFMYLYLRNLKISANGAFIGAISYTFSGFSIAWLEWNTIGQVVLWFPLILYITDKIIYSEKKNLTLFFLLSAFWSFAFFAGHLQIFLYLFVFSLIYFIFKTFSVNNKKGLFLKLIFSLILFTFITFIQWYPTWKFINLSARDTDLNNQISQPGWFLPGQNLIQFIAPDFFGNPATNNYWGIWNYGEFIGYIGIFPLLMSMYAIFFIRSKNIYFYCGILFLSIVLMLPNPLNKFLYKLPVPFVFSSQPTRLMSITVLCLCVLSAQGYDYIGNKNNISVIKKKHFLLPLIMLSLSFFLIWILLFFKKIFFPGLLSQLQISQRNMVLPTMIFFISSFLLIIYSLTKQSKLKKYFVVIIFMTLTFDLMRFSWKFIPFTDAKWIFPETKILNFLEDKLGIWRIMALDRRIMAPNFSDVYNLADVSGYDPLYLKSYNRFVNVWNNDNPAEGLGSFNRIITPTNYESFITDLIGVKYILSFDELQVPKLTKVYQEGKTILFENKNVFPRVFLVGKVEKYPDSDSVLKRMFELKEKLKKIAVTEENPDFLLDKEENNGNTDIIQYNPDNIIVKTAGESDSMLILTDMYYPDWKASVDGKTTKIYKTDYLFKGVFVPKGIHEVEFTAHII